MRSVLVLPCVVVLALTACSGGDDTSTPTTGASSGSSGATSSSSGGAATTVNGRTSFVDQTAGSAPRKIVWDTSLASNPNRCMKVKVGQTVAYEGELAIHPLAPSGGDTPTAFSNSAANGKVTFPRAGTFGYACAVHPSMTGAILVE